MLKEYAISHTKIIKVCKNQNKENNGNACLQIFSSVSAQLTAFHKSLQSLSFSIILRYFNVLY